MKKAIKAIYPKEKLYNLERIHSKLISSSMEPVFFCYTGTTSTQGFLNLKNVIVHLECLVRCFNANFPGDFYEPY